MKRSKIFISVILFSIIFIAGCNHSVETKSVAKGIENNDIFFLKDNNFNDKISYSGKNILQGIEYYLKLNARENRTAENVQIISTYPIDHGQLIFATFESSGKKYTSMFQIEQIKADQIIDIVNAGVFETNNKDSFTKNEMSGESSIKGEPKKLYNFIGGTVNNNKIKSLNIFLSDQSLVNVKVDSFNTYSYATTDGFASIKHIDGLDSEDNVIDSYPKETSK